MIGESEMDCEDSGFGDYGDVEGMSFDFFIVKVKFTV